ncbi:PIG-L deacetylase family protein [Kocuria massiliensis]|uniref:PIG-L deacetylase family protein n=1 Tax=Kocuria massiliensis TaxID=1926282 RepID=UPI000A1C81F5|nr:PIG-L deacetylase family protein [Kocuria massiliensis]
MKRLIVAPHMDDESMGCGGLLAKYPQECVVVVTARGNETRRREFQAAMSTLGVTEVIELNLPDGSVGEHMADLVGELDRVCRDVRPDELYLPFPSLHQDHISAYEAGMRTSRLSMSHDHWSTPSVYVYDVAVYDVSLYPSDLRWNVFEPLTETDAELKAEACRCYESETPGDSHPINAIKELAAAVGKVRGLPFAEQYALVRHVRS